ncbi:MAG: hypothetical protein V4732_02615 [Pseudomonadota bacterium]
MKIGKRLYELLQRVVKTRQKTVELTSTWKVFHTEFNVGKIIANRLHFSVLDLEKIRELSLHKLSIDPLFTVAEGDRIALSGITHNEKLSRYQVFANNVHVARFANLPIKTPRGTTFTPGNTGLALMDGDFDLSFYESVVLIENGTVFANWSSLQLPMDCSESLLMYRGHGSGIRTTYKILKARPSTCKLFGFFDFDPAGLAMALSVGCNGIVLPDDIDEVLSDETLRRLNKIETFHKQWIKNSDYLNSNPSPHLTTIVEKIRKYEVALTQEMLVRRNIKLKMYPV